MFSKDIEHICLYCEHGCIMQNGNHVMCRRKGIVTSDYCCSKFIYNPLKRIPKRKKTLISDFDKSDFSIQ